MSIVRDKAEGFQFTGWHMLACMLAFFGTIIAVNLFMAYKASGSWTGLVVKNSYVASQNFNSELAHADAQRQSGLRSNITYAGGRIAFTVSGRGGNALIPAKARIWVGRPAFEQLDTNLPASCDVTGNCTATMPLSPGAWSVKITADLANRSYRRDATLYVSRDGKVRVE